MNNEDKNFCFSATCILVEERGRPSKLNTVQIENSVSGQNELL